MKKNSNREETDEKSLIKYAEEFMEGSQWISWHNPRKILWNNSSLGQVVKTTGIITEKSSWKLFKEFWLDFSKWFMHLFHLCNFSWKDSCRNSCMISSSNYWRNRLKNYWKNISRTLRKISTWFHFWTAYGFPVGNYREIIQGSSERIFRT